MRKQIFTSIDYKHLYEMTKYVYILPSSEIYINCCNTSWHENERVSLHN